MCALLRTYYFVLKIGKSSRWEVK